MHLKSAQLLSLFGLAAIANAHFVLQEPTSLGFDDDKEGEGPCGSFNPTDRSTGVSNYPIGGSSIGVLTTHTHVTWKINAALLSDTSTFVPISQDVDQTGVGSFCFGNVPGNSAWVGQDAVLQVIQIGADGTLYQCAAIKFTAGGPGPIPNGCTNSTGVTASLIPGTGPTRGGSSSSSATSTPSSSISTPSSAASTPTSSSPGSSPAANSGASSSTGGSLMSSGGGAASTSKASSVSSSSPSASVASLSARSSSVAAASGSSTKASAGTISATQTGTSTSPQFTGGSNSLNIGNILFGGAVAVWLALGM